MKSRHHKCSNHRHQKYQTEDDKCVHTLLRVPVGSVSKPSPAGTFFAIANCSGRMPRIRCSWRLEAGWSTALRINRSVGPLV